ncbi:AP-4 complex accessory subunit RUSC1 [Trichomycterus rosablanca]|uniref:AP-4 complex accessory subunit RUSC1 n=1 Tax=Trichomycterus rosablanca TaxID=2290929 RepID=UPI002F351017
MSWQRRPNEHTNDSCNCGMTTDSYYSTAISNKQFTNSSFGNYHYASMIPDSPPPPPPPRPLPPCPQTLSHPPERSSLKPSTLPANSARPDRFDWLIAFTPDTDTLPREIKKHLTEATPQKSSSGPKVTTFKELRNRNKQASPPTQVHQEPDPAVITPDPDFLYNLKWRREKADGDGSQWEYTSQAQATFLQPPPTPESLARLRQTRLLNLKTDASQRFYPSPLSNGSANKNIEFNFGEDRNREHYSRKVEVGEDNDVRGMADGGQTRESRTRPVRSLSFAGSAAKAGAWMGDGVSPRLRGDVLPSLCLQEKKALVSAVSVAVEAILAQFSSSRTLVQKALSGDSSVNPTLGRLVLQCLCPAVYNLLCDGLKPHQSDVIAGRRPNSPWGLVQASTKLGPITQALYSLQTKVAALPQLKQSRHRFNAFLFGLLNIKRLDYWLLHLQTRHDVLETYYWPTSFMRLSDTSCQPLFDELLLMLQPLSLLTFNLDLLFQHHHLDPLCPELTPPSRSPHFSCSGLPQSSGQHLKSVSVHGLDSAALKADGHDSLTKSLDPGPTYCRSVPASSKGQTSPQLQWLQEKEIIAPPSVWSGNILGQQAGQALQQGWGAMMRWGERLGQNWSGFISSGSSEVEKGEAVPDLNTYASSEGQKCPDQEPLSADEIVPWGLGRLFGASKSPSNPPTKRRPSQWLSPGITALSNLTSPGRTFLPEQIEPGRNEEREKEKNEGSKETEDTPKPLRAVRTLCNHTGTGVELSFKKGEELLLLGGVDQDWIRCRQGDKEGLVPIGYASLIM